MSTYKITINQQEHLVEDQKVDQLNAIETGANQFHILQDGLSYQANLLQADFANKTMTIEVNGNPYEVHIADEYDQLVKQMGLSAAKSQKIKNIKAPMSGLILDILIKAGQSITKGDQLLILEAMKMENVLKAEGDGVVKSIEIEKGVAVDKGQILIEMK